MRKKFIGSLGFTTTAVFSILAILFLTTCLCYAEQGKDEDEFKAIVTETNSIFSESDEAMQKSPSFDVLKEKMKQFQPRFDALIARLVQFTIDYPASVYADDAAYILITWMAIPEKRLQKARTFLKKYPNASLEPLTLNTQQYSPVPKEIGVINAVKIDISRTLYDLRRYEESAKEARAVIDDLTVKALSDRGYRMLSGVYYYLIKDYEAQGKNEQVRRVCNEAIEKIPNGKNKEGFVKKLKELDFVPK